MGNYERTYQRIDELEQRRKEIKVRIKEAERVRDRMIEELDAHIASLLEELYDTEVGIGECEGYLAELRYIDGEE